MASPNLSILYKRRFHHAYRTTKSSIKDKRKYRKIVLDTTRQHHVSAALNVSNNFATIDYGAHIITKTYRKFNQVFPSMTVQELNTLHTICELERKHLIFAMSVQNAQLAGIS